MFVNHEVSKVLVEGDKLIGVEAKITSKPGSPPLRFHAPVVVSDVGVWNTFQKLRPADVPIPFRSELDEMLSDQHPGCTTATLYLGLDRDPRCMGFQGENYWIFEGLDHDQMAAGQDEILNGEPRGC